MSTQLILLGLLQTAPLHGYELKHIIEEHMGDWTNVAFGSIYFALGKLAENGYVEKISEEKVGNRPSRSIFRITDSGRNKFLALLRELWQKFDREYYSLDIAIAFSKALPPEEVTGYISTRIEMLKDSLVHVRKHRDEMLVREEVPKSAKLIFSHTVYHLEAEMKWLEELLQEAEKGFWQ